MSEDESTYSTDDVLARVAEIQGLDADELRLEIERRRLAADRAFGDR